jgi:hypothetical protein
MFFRRISKTLNRVYKACKPSNTHPQEHDETFAMHHDFVGYTTLEQNQDSIVPIEEHGFAFDTAIFPQSLEGQNFFPRTRSTIRQISSSTVTPVHSQQKCLRKAPETQRSHQNKSAMDRFESNNVKDKNWDIIIPEDEGK